MHTMSQRKVLLAILGIVFLLANPAGICAGTPSAQPGSHASHPCCPPPSGSNQHQGGTSGSCVCIDRQPAAPALPALADGGLYAPAAAVAVTSPGELRCEKANAPDRIVFPAESRFITLHQLLV
jgi:hypothetical protein